jgi:competence protein ComEC
MLWKIMPWCVFFIWFGSKIQDRYFHKNLKITFFDVGQGDSALIEFPGGKTMLIDAGGGFRKYNIGERVLFRELTKKGILTLDYALLTHPDQDHGYGFLGLFSEIGIQEFWFNGLFENSSKKLMKNIFSFLEHNKTQKRPFHQNEKRILSDAIIHLYPLKSPSTNNSSLVQILEYSRCKIAFTGDIEEPAEDQWLQNSLPLIDILKVAHHGSKTSSSEKFLNQIQPKVGIISVGALNRYGHPSTKVINRFLKNKTQILRTDFHGFIELSITPDGDYSCQSAKGFCGQGRCG